MLAHAPAGTAIRAVFLIQEIELRNGDHPHTIITFTNAGGQLKSAPVWASDRHRIEGLARGQPVEVTGVIGQWRDRPQLQLESIRGLAPDAVAWEELHPSIGDPGPWWNLLDGWRRSLRAPRLADTLAVLFDDPDFRRRFERCPASLNNHHARIGGLLQHTCEVAQLGLAAVAVVPQADRDVVLAGALLHDIGKLESYLWEGLFDTTVVGRVVGHVVLGARMLDRAQARRPTCHPEELELLVHLILSHHGHLEFGAPIVPLSLEAEILAHADLLSARTASFAEALSRRDLFRIDDQFSANPIWQLDHRRLWRGRSDWGYVPET